MLGIIVLFDRPLTPRLQIVLMTFIPAFLSKSISTCYRFSDTEETKQPQGITEPPPCFTVVLCVLFRVCFIISSPERPLTHRPENFKFSFNAPQNRITKPHWLILIVVS
ncbi:hypothetical protein ILYODFUR_022764 [Ilyodon furcidens]|uniref:Uncharacterized protein n=1 Tax=Ilyodon furcidens TaxID=33524 RepID=A0ABV0VGW2_9TELE